MSAKHRGHERKASVRSMKKIDGFAPRLLLFEDTVTQRALPIKFLISEGLLDLLRRRIAALNITYLSYPLRALTEAFANGDRGALEIVDRWLKRRALDKRVELKGRMVSAAARDQFLDEFTAMLPEPVDALVDSASTGSIDSSSKPAPSTLNANRKTGWVDWDLFEGVLK